MNRKTFLGFAMVAVVAALLVPTVGLARKTTLTFSMWLNSSEVKPTQVLFDQYEKKTGVKIKLIYSDYGSYLDKLLTMAASGKIPDVMVMDRINLPEFAEKGLLKVLDDTVRAEKFNPQKELTMPRGGFYRQKFYGFPIQSSPAMLFYIPEMLAKAGVPDINDYVAAGTWNWDTQLDAAGKMTKDTNGDGKRDEYGLLQDSWYYDWMPRVWQNGGAFFSDDYTKVLVNEPSSIAALKHWSELSSKFKVSPPVGGAGKYAMFTSWLSTYPAWSQSMKQKPQMSLLPAGKAGYATVGGGNPVAISRSTKSFLEAYRFARWFALESDYWKTVGQPALKKTFDTDYQKWMSKYFTHPELVSKALENVQLEAANHPRHRDIFSTYYLYTGRLAAGKVSAEQAADSMYKELTRLIGLKR